MSDLNKYLQPDDSFAAQPSTLEPSVNFDINTDRNIIGNTKLKNFSFNAGTGGTIVLGGTANGNGQLLIKDALGNTIVQGDNAGLTIYNGNILIKNDSNTTILDTSGIVSTANFPNDILVDNTQRTTTGTSYTAVPGAAMNPFVLTRTTNVLVNLFAAGYNNRNDIDGASIQIQGSDSLYGELFNYPLFGFWSLNNIDFVGQGWTTTNDNGISSISAIFSFGTGTHTLGLNFKNNISGTSKLNSYALSYIILGA